MAALAWLALNACLFARPVLTLLFPVAYLTALPILPVIVWAYICKCLDVYFLRALFYRDCTVLLMAISVGNGLVNPLRWAVSLGWY